MEVWTTHSLLSKIEGGDDPIQSYIGCHCQAGARAGRQLQLYIQKRQAGQRFRLTFEVRFWKVFQRMLFSMIYVHHPAGLLCTEQPLPLWMQTSLLTLLSLFVSPDTTGSEAHCGDFHHFLSMLFSPLWPVVFLCLFLHPDLKSCTGKGTSKIIPFWYCVLALAIPRISFSINTKVHLQDSRVMFGDSLVCCRCALPSWEQIPAKNQAAVGGRESSWQSQLLSSKVRGEQDPASPRGTWNLLCTR